MGFILTLEDKEKKIYKRKGSTKMTSLKEFKKDMRNYFNTVVDRESGETFKSWFSALFEALEEEKKVIRQGGKTYILD